MKISFLNSKGLCVGNFSSNFCATLLTGKQFRLYDLRHLHATELLRLDEPLHVVAQRLGHCDAMVTATVYTHATDQEAETASGRFANAFNA